MKNSILINTVIGIVCVGVIAFAYQSRTTKSTMTEQSMSNDQMREVTTSDTTSGDLSHTNGRYVAFTPEVLQKSSNTRRVLFFYANWCPTCRPADKNFMENIDKIPNDVTLIRVNYNDTDTDETEKELAKKYGVTYQHTYVQIDSQGNEITKWNGGQIEELLKNTK
jgi:thiol-disulfide isomerase/thioredoxin